MNQDMIFVPALLHMLLVFFLFIKLGSAKTKAIKLGQVDREKTALNPKAWPDDVVKISNNIGNQFESPILFYILSILFYLSGNVSNLVIGIMFFYVASRYLHAYFHVTSNFVPHRFKAFLVGFFTLLVMTIWLLLAILFS